jgi:hypothetical protein
VSIGQFFMFCGLCLIVGFPAALLAIGALIWLTTIIATHFAVAMKQKEPD